MQLVRQSCSVIGETPYDFEDLLLWIERAGRTCYKSFDKIVEGSGRTFIRGIIERGHFSVIEHSNLVLRSLPQKFPVKFEQEARIKFNSPFIYTYIERDRVYVFGNYRAFLELLPQADRNWLSFCKLASIYTDSEFSPVTNPGEVPKPCKYYTVRFITNRAMTHELVRHRPATYSQESQRYCKYINALRIIIPYQYYGRLDENSNLENVTDHEARWFLKSMQFAEMAYKELLKTEKAQQARNVLPNAAATEIMVTAPIKEWDIIFGLRTGRGADPQMIDLMSPLKEEFKRRDYLLAN